MKSKPSIFCLALCAGLIGNFAAAQDQDKGMSTPAPSAAASAPAVSVAPKRSPEPYKWLTKEQEQALTDTVPPFPVVDSPADKDDVAAMVAAQKARTPEIEAECKLDKDFSAKLFQVVYGSNITPEKAPKFYEMLTDVLDVTYVVNGSAKDKFKRLRPYQAHPDEVTALFSVNGFSYPSGHSMASFTLATVLGVIFPDKQQAFLDRAAKIAQSRVDAGVHYPSDIHEGEVLGKATGAELLANEAFQKSLAEVREELKNAGQ